MQRGRAPVADAVLMKKGNRHFSQPLCIYSFFAASPSCVQESSTGAGFTYWLTVSITIPGMIGSFKCSEEPRALYLLLFFFATTRLLPTVTVQWNVEMCCIGLFLLHGYCFFGFVTQIPLLYFEWFIHMNEDLCLRAQCAGIIQSNSAAQWLLRLH